MPWSPVQRSCARNWPASLLLLLHSSRKREPQHIHARVSEEELVEILSLRFLLAPPVGGILCPLCSSNAPNAAMSFRVSCWREHAHHRSGSALNAAAGRPRWHLRKSQCCTPGKTVMVMDRVPVASKDRSCG